jgi:hypothetical protein
MKDLSATDYSNMLATKDTYANGCGQNHQRRLDYRWFDQTPIS